MNIKQCRQNAICWLSADKSHPSPAEVGGLGIEFIKYIGLYLGLPVHVLAYIGVISHSLNAKCRYLGILQNIYYSQVCKVNIRHTNIVI